MSGKAEDIDEACCISLIVNLILVECSNFLIIESIGGCNACIHNVALVELELYIACNGLLGIVNESGKCFPERCEPLAVVYEISKLDGEIGLHPCGLLIKAYGLESIVCLVEDRSAGSLIYTSGLHTNETVLNEVHEAYAVLAAELVEIGYELYAVHCLAVNSGGDTLFKMYGNICSLVGSLLGRNAELKEAFLVVLRLVCGILKIEALVGEMPDVLVLGIVGLSCYAQGDIVCLCIVDLLVS